MNAIYSLGERVKRAAKAPAKAAGALRSDIEYLAAAPSICPT